MGKDKKKLSADEFRRLTSVMRDTFAEMINLLTTSRVKKKALGGRANKLGLEGTLLMALEYLREYRTYFHISQSYGLSESYAYKLIKWVEDTLLRVIFSAYRDEKH